MFLKRFLKSIFSSNLSFKNPIFVENKENMKLMVSELESENILAIDTVSNLSPKIRALSYLLFIK